MNKFEKNQSAKWSAASLTKMALVTALYVTVTLVFSVISFGAIEFRLAEMFNYLAVFNKRYIIAVTLGVMLANLASPLGMIDVIVGGLSTFCVLVLVYFVTRKIKNQFVKLAVTTLICSFSMFTIAAQLTLLLGIPFWFSWLTIGLGEFVSMTIGGVLIHWISKKIDLTK